MDTNPEDVQGIPETEDEMPPVGEPVQEDEGDSVEEPKNDVIEESDDA